MNKDNTYKKLYFSLKKQTESILEYNKRIRRQINCVKDHPEIKPKTCCWTGDSLLFKDNQKDLKDLQGAYEIAIKEIVKLRGILGYDKKSKHYNYSKGYNRR